MEMFRAYLDFEEKVVGSRDGIEVLSKLGMGSKPVPKPFVSPVSMQKKSRHGEKRLIM